MAAKVAVTGASGMIATCLIPRLEQEGFEVVKFVRSPKDALADPKSIAWDIEQGKIDMDKLEGTDIVIHLSGASLAQARWTHLYKQVVYNSRIHSTSLLSHALSNLKTPPKLLLSASAVGFYGSQPAGKKIDETSLAGEGFLAKLCEHWEQAASLSEKCGIRVVKLRLGMVLSGRGGALKKMLPIFKLGLGGPIGDGRQMISWVTLEEIPEIALFLIQQESISGPVNCVSPHPVSNKDFTKNLAEVLHRPAVLPVPKPMLRILLGEMADELLIGGVEVYPQRLLDRGYRFRFPELKSSLELSLI